MNRIKFIYIYIFVVTMFLCLSFSKNNKDIFIKKDFSRSLHYYYEVTENENSFFVKIYSKENGCEFSDETEYRKFDRFYICWDESYDKLWIWSSDIGFYTVTKKDVWIKQSVILANTTKEMIPSKMLNNIPFLQRYYK